MKILAPAGGALLAGLIIHVVLKGSAAGGGVAEIMEAVALRQRSLGLKASLLKSLGSVLMMSSGGSLGREGPCAAVSAAISTRIAHLLHITPSRRNILIGCGVASGMAAVYNAPLGASLFVMEVVIGNFAMDVFGPLVAASVMATLVSRALWESGPIYEVATFIPSGVGEYFILGLLGIPCALVGNAFTGTLQRFTDLCQTVKIPPVLKVTLGGLLVGVLGIWLPHVWGNGNDALAGTLNDQFPIHLLAAICVGKIVATSLSLGSGGLGGVMTPTLLVGATFGALVSHLIQPLGTGFATQPGAYALVGMAGVLAATTHAPIMATFLTFELSQEYGMILPLGVCAGVSALMARRLKKNSIYSERLARKGLDLDAAIEETALQAIRVEDVVWRNPPTVPPGMPARSVMEIFLQSRRHLLHVVGEDGTYYGLIAVQDIYPAAEDRNLDDLVVAMDLARPMPAVTPESPVPEIMEKFWFQEYGELPVLRGTRPQKFAGVVTRRDILGAFDREILRRRSLTARYKLGLQPAGANLPLVGDFALEEVPVPSSMQGKTLAEIALPRTFSLTAVALKHGPPDAQVETIPPPLDHEFEPGDRLILMGRRSDIASFSRQ
jgi:CIC family chloride channel protein